MLTGCCPIAGAIQGNSTNITILDSTFLNNTGTTGAVSLLGGSLDIYNSTFSYNTGTQVCAVHMTQWKIWNSACSALEP